jgi:hypothetical protein
MTADEPTKTVEAPEKCHKCGADILNVWSGVLVEASASYSYNKDTGSYDYRVEDLEYKDDYDASWTEGKCPTCGAPLDLETVDDRADPIDGHQLWDFRKMVEAKETADR